MKVSKLTLKKTMFIVSLLITSLGEGNTLVGRVVGDQFSLSEILDKAEKLKIENEEELMALSKDSPQPVKNATVVLYGNSFFQQTTTDENGAFKFSNVNEGKYELTALMKEADKNSDRENKDGGFVRQNITIKKDKNIPVELRLCPVYANICGKITDAQGNPVAGAKVSAVYVSPSIVYQQALETHSPPTWTTISKADGSYEIQGIIAASSYDLIGFLLATKAPKHFAVISVAIKGISKTETNRIPLITEKQIKLAQRLLHIYQKMPAKGKGLTEHNEHTIRQFSPLKIENICKELKKPFSFLPIPTSTNSTITGVDVVVNNKL